MNHRSRILAAVLTLMVAVWLTACGDDKTTDTGGSEPPQPPAFTTHTVTVPEHMRESSDPNAQMAVGYVDMANGLGAYSAQLSPPAGAQGASAAGTWTYTWEADSLTVTLIVIETNELYPWDVFYDGTLEGQTFDNWKAMHAEAAKDGSSGEFVFYEFGTTQAFMMWTWSTDAQGVFTFVMFYYGETGDGKIEVTVNPDGSGSLAFYEGDGGVYELTFLVEWNTDGTGQWWTYEGGAETDSGTWT